MNKRGHKISKVDAYDFYMGVSEPLQGDGVFDSLVESDEILQTTLRPCKL